MMPQKRYYTYVCVCVCIYVYVKRDVSFNQRPVKMLCGNLHFTCETFQCSVICQLLTASDQIFKSPPSHHSLYPWRLLYEGPMCYFILFYFILLFAFWATLVAYGGSQAKGGIGAAAASLHHSSLQCWILNPLS